MGRSLPGQCNSNYRMPNSRREKQLNRTRCLRGNSPPSRAPQGPAQAAGLAPRLNPAHRTRPLSEYRQPRPSFVKHSAQIELQSLVSGRESQRMRTAETSTSELAKNWPSTLGRFTEVWWAQLDLNQRPDDYESPALTAELWAQECHVELLVNTYSIATCISDTAMCD